MLQIEIAFFGGSFTAITEEKARRTAKGCI